MKGISAFAFVVLSCMLLRYRDKWKLPITCIYIAALISVAFLSREPMPMYHYSIYPFGAARKAIEFGGGLINSILNGTVKITSWISLEGIILNILLFVPFGYLTPMFLRKIDRWWKIALIGVLVSVGIEIIQLITRLGYADVDDLINNTLGALIGYGLYKLILNNSKTQCRREGQHGQ